MSNASSLWREICRQFGQSGRACTSHFERLTKSDFVGFEMQMHGHRQPFGLLEAVLKVVLVVDLARAFATHPQAPLEDQFKPEADIASEGQAWPPGSARRFVGWSARSPWVRP